MSITPTDIINAAGHILNDESNIKWTTTEGLKWVNMGQAHIVLLKPDANVVRSATQLVAGTKQSLPTGGITLVDVARNLGTSGTTIGDAITRIDKAMMDRILPGWHASTSSATVAHWMYDARIPSTWWCFPPQPSSSMGYVEIFQSQLPTEASTVSTALTIADYYKPVLVEYYLFRAFSKDGANQTYMQRAMSHFQQAVNLLGLQGASQGIANQQQSQE